MSITQLGALIYTDAPAAKVRILDAIKTARGDKARAAEELEVTPRSLYRYIERLALWDEIDALISTNNFRRIVGPPRVADRIRDAILVARGNLPRAAQALGVPVAQLRDRIEELHLWDDLNRRLEAQGCPQIKIQRARGASASAR